MNPKPGVSFISFDHKDVVDDDELTTVATNGCVHFKYVPDTGSDQYVLCASKMPLSEVEVQEQWELWQALESF